MRSTLLLLGSAALLATACSSKESSTVGNGTVILALSGDAISLFPPAVVDLTGRMVQDLVFDRLAEIGPDLNTLGDKGFAPRLAQKWTWARDSMSIAFSIDPRARWHDGKPVTASDVRFSLKTFKDTAFASPVAALVTNLDSVHVQDSLTAVVWFKKHLPEQFYDVAYQLIIFPEHVYGGIPAKDMRTAAVARAPIGSGQFRFVRWDPNVRLELVADTANYRGRPKIDRIIITPTPDGNTGATQVLTGQADLYDNFPFNRVQELDTSKVARPSPWFNLGGIYLAMNPNDPKSKSAPHPIFSDLRTRRALSMAVDRVGMLKNVFGDKGKLARGPFPSSAWYADSSVHPLPYDTVAAKAMLDSSGWRLGANGIRAKNGRPLHFTIIVGPSIPRRRYSVLLQDQFKRIGAQVDVDNVDNPSAVAHQNNHDFDAIIASFVPDPNPGGLRQVWGTEGIGPDGQNFTRYSSKRFDALLDSSSASFDQAKMKSYATRAIQTVIADAPAIFLYDFIIVHGVNRRITMAPMRTDEWWANLADWSIPPAKRIARDSIPLSAAKR